MITKCFNSNKSKDSIEIIYFKKSHKSDLNIKMVDSVYNHAKIIEDMLNYLKNNGIQWICVNINNNKNPIIPENTVYFKHDKSNRICCHIVGFNKFYFKNIMQMVTPNDIYVDKNANVINNGWTVVIDKKKLKMQKYDNIKKDVDSLIKDLNKILDE